MDGHDLWRSKTDDEVLTAYANLEDFTDEGQEILRSELSRRQLVPLAPSESPARAEQNARPDPLPDNPFVRLWVGGYSLPLSYWGWYWGGSFVWRGLLSLGPKPTAESAGAAGAFLMIWIVCTLSYLVVAAVGVNRSARFYKGRPAWATLARIAVAAGVALAGMQLIYVWLSLSQP